MHTLRDLEFQVRITQAVMPDARFIVWLGQEPTNFFAENYPDELLSPEVMKGKWLYGMHQYSYGSEVWGKYCAVGLKKLIYELRRKPYADKIVGIAPGLGRFGENNWAYATMTEGWAPHDTGKAMTNFFRKWLLREYRSDLRTFRQAWDRKDFNFTDAQVPGLERRSRRKTAFDHVGRRDVFDYSRCESFALLHRVLEQVQAAKEGSDHHWLTMAQFGYFTEGIFHRELATALNNHYLDALGPAPPYINRGVGDDIMDHGPAAAVRQAGKIWFFQADVRSHLCQSWDRPYGSTANVQESIAVYLRDLGHYMTTGAIPYYMSFYHWYDAPELYALVGRFDELMQLSSYFSRRSKAEIAVVSDPLSLAAGYEYNYQRCIKPPYQSTIGYNRQLEWHHLGAPYDYFLLDNLLESRQLEQYKLVLMADSFALTEKQRRLIRERLYRDGRTIVWLYAPGYIREDHNILSQTEQNTRISDFRLKLDPQTHNLALNLTPEAGKWLALPDNYGTAGFFRTPMYGGFTTPDKPLPIRPEEFNPRFQVVPEPGVEILGHYREDKAPAFAVRRFNDYTSVFWGSTALDRDVLFGLAKNAGVHRYTEQKAVVYANENFASIHVPASGIYRIKLPYSAETVYDLYADRELAANSGELSVEMAKNSSLLLYFGKKDALKQATTAVMAKRQQRQQENNALLAAHAFDPLSLKPPAKPAESGRLYTPDRSGFICHWLLLGPFPNDGTAASCQANEAVPDFSRQYQVTFRPQSPELAKAWGLASKASKELELQWQPIEFSNGITAPLFAQINHFFSFNRIIYYLACNIITDSEIALTLCVGSDDGHEIYLNGRLVSCHLPGAGRSLSLDSEKTPVKLKAGKNLMLVKITQLGGGLGHAVRFRQNGKVFTNFRIELPAVSR